MNKFERYHYDFDFINGKYRATLKKNGAEYDILEDEVFTRIIAKISDSGILDKMKKNSNY